MAKQKALPLTEAGTLPKADVLERWRALAKHGTIYFEANPADATGSSYEGDSIRLTGSLKAIDSVLGNLKSLLRYDDTKTRLDIAFSQQKKKGSQERVPGKFVVYVKVVEKLRTTRARAAVAAPAPTPRPARAPRPPRAAAPAPVTTTAPGGLPAAAQQAVEALRVLGQTPVEAQRRLALVVAEHSPGLDCPTYVTLALRVSVPKQAPPK